MLILLVLAFLGMVDTSVPFADGGAVPPPEPETCERADLARAYSDMVASGQLFFAVAGTFAPDADISGLPDGPWRTMAAFDGVRFDADGSETPIETRVLIDGSCAAGDCGGLVPGEAQVALALFDDGGLRIETRPCGATPVAATPEALEVISSCVTGGDCSPN